MTTFDKAQQKQVLSEFLQATMNEESWFIASWIAPSVKVIRDTGERKSFGRQAMRIYAWRRAVGGRYKRIDFETQVVDTWNLVDHWFFGYVYTEEMENKEMPIQASQAKLKLMAQIMMLNYEEAVASAITTSTISNYSIPTSTNKWDAYSTSDPITQIEDAKETVRLWSGKKPNAIAMSRTAFRILKHHPKVLSRFVNVTYVTDQMLEEKILRDILGFKYVHIGEAMYEDANLEDGVLSSDSDLIDIRGEKTLIYYKKENAEIFDTMFMWTFEKNTWPQAWSFMTTDEDKKVHKRESGVVTNHKRDIVIIENKCAYLFDNVLT